MKKSSKQFVISSEAQNSSKFRVRTSGINIDQFNKNPLLLWMHQRPKGLSTNEVLPLGYWDDLHINEKGQLMGTPLFDDTDDFAMKIYNKVENGTLRMASAGLSPVEWIEDVEGKWLEKSVLLEGTLCDIGQNPESLAVVLYDQNDNVISLSEQFLQNVFPTNKSDNMKKIELSASILPKINLAEGATAEDVQQKIEELVTLSSTQTTQINTLQIEKADAVKLKEKAEADLKQHKSEAEEAEKNTYLDKAIKVDHKLTEDQRESFVALNLDTIKAIVDKMPANPTAKEFTTEAAKKASETMVNLTWDQLDKEGKLITLKETDKELFKTKFKEKFNKEYED